MSDLRCLVQFNVNVTIYHIIDFFYLYMAFKLDTRKPNSIKQFFVYFYYYLLLLKTIIKLYKMYWYNHHTSI